MTPEQARAIVEAVALAFLAEGLPIRPADLNTGFDSGVRFAVNEPELARRWLEAQQVEIFTPAGVDFGTEPDSLALHVAAAVRDPEAQTLELVLVIERLQ